jgi:ribosome-associated protein
MLRISGEVTVPAAEIEISAVRSQGAGGQNVNKVASAIHLRFDIGASSLPGLYKERLLKLSDQRITKDGVVVIKAQQYRSREKNLEEALRRLRELLRSAAVSPRKRIPTRPTAGSRRKRVESKVKHGRTKAMRAKVVE